MSSNDELKGKLLSNLKKYPLIDEFFRNMIEKRIQREGWLAQDLCQIVIKETQENIQTITNLLRDLKSSDKTFQEMKQKLDGDDQKFDGKIRDLFAEIYAYSYLKSKGFSNIQLIPRDNKKTPDKTPDFKAEKAGRIYIAEAKNLRAPDSILNFIFNRLDELYIRAPEFYGRYAYEIDATVEAPGEQNDQADKSAVETWLNQLEVSLRQGVRLIDYTWSKNLSNGTLTKKIKCKVTLSPSYDISGNYVDQGGCYLDKQSIECALLPRLENKLRSIVDTAKKQLLDFDDPRVLKLILLNWQKPPVVQIFDSIIQFTQKVTVELIPQIKDDLKKLDDTIEIILLPDNLCNGIAC